MPRNPDEAGRSPMARAAPKAVAIVPAAGESRRMGTAKLLLPWGTTTVIETVIAAWRQCRIESVYVVVSPGDDALASVCRAAGANVVVPATPPADMKASIQAAIEQLRQTANLATNDCLLIAPADMPWIEHETIDRLIAEFAASPAEIVAPTHGGRRGHPIVLPWSLALEVLSLAGDESLKTVVERHRMRTVECNDTVLGDLDTPEDYRTARERFGI